tara:strand:- start:1989 stop:2306 length:318 start_codon:yes stop_codon:yes gene_type:complete
MKKRNYKREQEIFSHLGYHLDVFHLKTRKFMGSILMSKSFEDSGERQYGYEGRKVEHLKAHGMKALNRVAFDGEYITELIPLCGRVIDRNDISIREIPKVGEWKN